MLMRTQLGTISKRYTVQFSNETFNLYSGHLLIHTCTVYSIIICEYKYTIAEYLV